MDILRAVGAALVVGLAVGVALGFADALFPSIFRWLFRAAGLVGAGYLVGEAVSVATNRKRGGPFQIIAVVGFVASYAVFELLTPGLVVSGLYTIVGLHHRPGAGDRPRAVRENGCERRFSFLDTLASASL